MKDTKLIPIKLLLIPDNSVDCGNYRRIYRLSDTDCFFLCGTEVKLRRKQRSGCDLLCADLVIALMFFLLRQGYKGYEFIALGLLSLVYSLSLKR